MPSHNCSRLAYKNIRLLVPIFVLAALCSSESTQSQTSGAWNADVATQGRNGLPRSGTAIITGIVVNERLEPVARATVQAFSPDAPIRQLQAENAAPSRASGRATTDDAGRFRITGLQSGEYIVAATPVPFVAGRSVAYRPLYAITFFPSTLDRQLATTVTARNDDDGPIQIQLVRTRGARISGAVVSPAGRSTAGMSVTLFHEFGDFGAGATIATVGPHGGFQSVPVPPGSYRITVQPPSSSEANDGRGEFATRLIKVGDRDLDLEFAVTLGASISGRVVREPGANILFPYGLRVYASPTEGSVFKTITATVGDDWSFRITGLTSFYRFSIVSIGPPFITVTRATVDGVELAGDTAGDFSDGTHEVVLFVKDRELPKPAFDSTLPTPALMERFKSERVFWRQFEIAQQIVNRRDISVLLPLSDWLNHEDRRLRGNAAFILGRLGDPRGFQVITEILTDRESRPHGQEVSVVAGDGRYRLDRQIRADRYYAAHLLGDLRDPKAVPILIALLKDPEINAIVPWSLAQIGDKRAIEPLLETLDDDSPTMRVLVILALESLKAAEALPRLTLLLDDHRRSNIGAVSVSEAAKAAIARLRR